MGVDRGSLVPCFRDSTAKVPQWGILFMVGGGFFLPRPVSMAQEAISCGQRPVRVDAEACRTQADAPLCAPHSDSQDPESDAGAPVGVHKFQADPHCHGDLERERGEAVQEQPPGDS